MRTAPRPLRGFTLIEVMIVVTLIALMVVLAGPSINVWLQNLKIRNVGESLVNGMQLARMEAMKRNERVTFWMVDNTTASCADSASSPSWMVVLGAVSPGNLTGKCTNDFVSAATSTARTIQKNSASSALQGLTIAATGTAGTASSCVTYDGLGQLPTQGSIGCAAPISQITIRSSVADTVQLDIRLTTGGQVRLCYPDPNGKLDATDPRKC